MPARMVTSHRPHILAMMIVPISMSDSRVVLGTYRPQLQAPPQQLPPGADEAARARPVIATAVSSLTVSSCPCGQAIGAFASLIGRVRSKQSPQARHR